MNHLQDRPKHASILSVAPMIQWTDSHFRYYLRGITKKTLLYTEMTMANTICRKPMETLQTT